MIARVRALTRTITELYEQLAGLVKQVVPQLLAEKGLGVLIAAKLIGEIAGIDRFTSDAQLARLSGCAPIPVSSGRTDRHRLDPAGTVNPTTRCACSRSPRSSTTRGPRFTSPNNAATGKSNREAIRSSKRHLVRRVYHLLRDPNSVAITICLT